jgi:hypothetical protein
VIGAYNSLSMIHSRSSSTTYRAMAVAGIGLNVIVIGLLLVTRPRVACSTVQSQDPAARSDPTITKELADQGPGRGTYEHCTIARWDDRDGPDRFAVISGLSADDIHNATCLSVTPTVAHSEEPKTNTEIYYRYLEQQAAVSLRHARVVTSGMAVFRPNGASLQRPECTSDSGIYSVIAAERHAQPVVIVNYYLPPGS